MSKVVMGGFVDDLLVWWWFERTRCPEAEVYGTNWCKVIGDVHGSTMRSEVREVVALAVVCFRMN